MSKSIIARAALSLAIAASLTGCYTVKYDVTTLPDNSVSMTQVSKAPGRKFTAEQMAVWILYGLLPIVKPDVKEAIRENSRGKRVQNVSFKDEVTGVDGLINFGISAAASLALTAVGAGAASIAVSLIAPTVRTITVEGELVER
jgi:hypothetical protein